MNTSRIEIQLKMKHAIKFVKNKKAAGSEGLTAEIRKNESKKLQMVMSIIFDKYLHGYPVQVDWKIVYISTTTKKSVKSTMSRYLMKEEY